VATFRLTLEYAGGGFEGWQVQPSGRRTVQGVLEEAVARVTGEPVRVVGSGRTDAGVHAEAQVASLSLAAPRDPGWLQRALNGVLPRDLAVIGCVAAPEGFHARHDAVRKLYRYAVWNAPSPSPLRAGRSHWVCKPLAVDAMRAAAACLVGSHDFAAFQAAGSQVRTTRRSLERLELRGAAGGEVAIEVLGSGFLRHMVRILAGTLLEVGLGRRAAESLTETLASRDRRRAGRTAPAHGLTLVRVEYELPPGASA
jgi:tRNA pseudouridine38-40 synthase